MRLVLLATVILGLGLASSARAQQPGFVGPPSRYPQSPFGGLPIPTINPANVMPNIYNPRTQPLSPYLNLFGNASNPGVNYYYGVRPGTIGGAASMGGAPSVIAGGGNRPAFFPQLAQAPDPFDNPLSGTGALSDDSNGFTLPPAGHPVVFGNTLGFFPGPPGSQNVRPGLAGLGNSRPAGRK